MEEKREKWYFKKYVFIIAVLSIGPLALPLAWFNPHFSIRTKILISIAVVILTYILVVLTMNSLKVLLYYYNQLAM